MKKIAFALLLLVGAFPLRADVLVNSNFANGRANWQGDAKDPDDSGNLSGGSDSSAGVVINLKKDAWSKIYQAFPVRASKFYYTITFKVSSDYHIAAPGDMISSSPDFTDIPGFRMSGEFPESRWEFIVRNTGRPWMSSYKSLTVDGTKTSTQTLTGRLSELSPDADGVLVLAFPPGEGSITLFNISLSTDAPTP